MSTQTETVRHSPRVLSARPASALFLLVLLCGVLPNAPGVQGLSAVTKTATFVPLAAAWVVLTILAHWPVDRAAAGRVTSFALVFIALGAVSVIRGNAEASVWWATLVIPALLWVGIQFLDRKELVAAVASMRAVLFLAVVLQVWFYLRFSGVGDMLSPDLVFARHTDVVFWAEAGGRVLGNPNNASVIFCAAFGWALMDFARGRRGLGAWAFMGFGALAIFVTGSRGAVLAGVVLVLLTVGLSRRTRWVLWLAAALTLVGVVANGTHIDALSFASNGAGDSLQQRFGTRGAALPVVLSSPFGAGVGQAAASIYGDLGAVFVGSDYRGATSHDLFLNWGLNLGWLGLLGLCAVLVVTFRRGVGRGGWLPMLPLIGFLLAGTTAGIEVLTTSTQWATVFFVLLGLIWRTASEEPAEREELHRQREADR